MVQDSWPYGQDCYT